ncbi:MAG: VWA domain-containing protein [Candidatus Liptonbacteria bacterium]|nr:VWA domain-containing protein [Candidatus Liptonbacteria bacterium]
MLIILAAVIFLAAVLMRRNWARRKNFLLNFAATGPYGIDTQSRKKVWSYAFGALAIILFFLALAEPVVAGKKSERSVRTVIVFDVSESMKADDVKPTRLKAAADQLKNLFEAVPYGEASLIIFGEEPYVATLKTSDMSEIVWTAEKWLQAGRVPLPGSDLVKTIIFAANYAHEHFGENVNLILLSDGADTGREAVSPAVSAARKFGVRIIAIGTGTHIGATVELRQSIVTPSEYYEGEAVTEVKVKKAFTRLEEGGMRELAVSTGGAYALAQTGYELSDIFQKHDIFFVKTSADTFVNRYEIPLVGALIFLLLWFFATYKIK